MLGEYLPAQRVMWEQRMEWAEEQMERIDTEIEGAQTESSELKRFDHLAYARALYSKMREKMDLWREQPVLLPKEGEEEKKEMTEAEGLLGGVVDAFRRLADVVKEATSAEAAEMEQHEREDVGCCGFTVERGRSEE